MLTIFTHFLLECQLLSQQLFILTAEWLVDQERLDWLQVHQAESFTVAAG